MAELAVWGSVLSFPNGNPELTQLQDGRILLTWSNAGNIQAMILNADGSIAMPTFTVNQRQGNPGIPNVAVLSNGDFVIVYNQKNPTGAINLVWHRFTADGISLGETAIQKNITRPPKERVVPTHDGGFVVTYEQEEGGSGLSAGTGQIVVNAQGSTADFLLYPPTTDRKNTFTLRDTEALSSGSYVTLFEHYFNGETTVGFDIRLNGARIGNYRTVASSSSEHVAQVVALSTGQFAVIWISPDKKILGQIIEGGGSNSGAVFTIDDAVPSFTNFNVTGISDGKFAIGYAEAGTMFVKVINATGEVEASSAISDSSATTPLLTGLKDGRLLFTWGPTTSLKAQIFDPRTGPVDWTGDSSGQQYGGTKFGDHLRGAGGDDTLFGGAGNDVLNGGEGSDRLDGGGVGDWDRVTYLDTPTAQGGVIVDLSDNSNNGGAAAGDVLINIESLQGTNQADTLVSIDRGGGSGAELHGEGGNDTLTGKGGGDRLFGGAGNDVLDGGGGADRLDGGDDWDVVTYAGVTGQGVIVDLATNQNGGAAAGDELFGIEEVVGTNQRDVITGIIRDAGHGVRLWGMGGDDVLTGKDGADHLLGGDDNDILNGGAGGDILDGGAGWDLVTYIDVIGQGVIVDLSGGTSNDLGARGDILIDIESVQGTNQADSLVSVDRGGGNGAELLGEGGNDTLVGMAGGDRLFGGEGDDVLNGGGGGDVMAGGKGDDVYYVDSANDTVFELGFEGTDTVHAWVDFDISAWAIEHVILEGTADLNIVGNVYDNALTGNDGNNRIFAAEGNDTVKGGVGNDMMTGGAGDDYLDGEDGIDTARFSGSYASYSLVENSDGTFTIKGQDGEDVLKRVEYAAFDDQIVRLTPGGVNLPPVIDGLSNSSVDEDADPASVIGTFSAHDPEDGTTELLYELKNEDGQAADANGLFEVDPVTGQLRVKTTLQDVNGNQDFTITLKVSDRSGGAGSAATYQTFTITVMDVVGGNHAPTQLKLNGGTAVTVNENAGFAGALSAQDSDGDTSFTWSFDDTVAGNANALFEIDNSGTGNKKLKLKAGIDYEALPAGQKFVTVYMKASDGKGGTSTTQAFTINVADLDETPPNRAPTNLSLSGDKADEYAMAGREVGTLSASDADHDGLSYTLLDNAGGRFVLSGNRILVADGFRLDYEQAQSHNVTVQVSDGKGGVASQTFTIRVGDINPEFTMGTAGNDVFHGGAMNDVLLGNGGHDRLFGGAGKDTLKGEAGNDTIGGGAGNDKLYGTKGAASRDAFVFDTKLTSKSVANRNKDVIYDFGPKYDSIYLDDAAFTNKTIARYLKGKGASLDHAYKMKSSFFRVGDKARDRDDFFIAKKVKPTEYKLYFDVDGSGAKAMLEIGTVKLQKGEGKTLTHKDFFFI